MPNESLDSYIFGGLGSGKKHLLAWRRRFSVIVGIARGLVYLYRDSRLQIIHRDFKAGNVLLDSEMNSKISDFGITRTFGEQFSTKTKKVAGTYGYMAPEYVFRGIFSKKSDVFSFGVLVLEIVSGQRNNHFHHPDHDYLNLLGYAWKLCDGGKASKLIDPLMEDSFAMSEVLRCIQIGLLCVQQQPIDRPTMETIILMLDSENAMLQQPKRPEFYMEKVLYDDSGRLLTSNNASDTLIGR